jgi:hypothetical protein
MLKISTKKEERSVKQEEGEGGGGGGEEEEKRVRISFPPLYYTILYYPFIMISPS